MRLDGVPFNLDVTLCCGQVFRWDRKGDWWYGVVGDRPFKVRQNSAELEFEGTDEALVVRYFGLDDDLQKIGASIGRDEHIQKALRAFWGLRLIRQEPWECLVSYICATYKNIPAIRQMLLKLSRKFGKKKVFDGGEFFTFPSPKKLACASEKRLSA